MRQLKNWIIALVVVLAVSLLIFANVFSASDAGYSLSKFSLEGGVFEWNTGGGYEIGGTIGQHDAWLATGGEYQLGGGVWPGGKPVEETHIYLPVVKR